MMRDGAVSARDIVVAFIVLFVGLVVLRIGMSMYAFIQAHGELVEQQHIVEQAYRSLVQEHIVLLGDKAEMFSDVTAKVAAISPGSLVERENQILAVQRTLGAVVAGSSRWSPELHANEHIVMVLKESGGRGKISELLVEYNRRLSTLKLASETFLGKALAGAYGTGDLHFLYPDGKERGTTVFM